ncbi:MAG TPA: hypothetical protein ENK62_08410 [Chromatiales bacterium]|nr:hypothetical protein [Chromatiales bacterium]
MTTLSLDFETYCDLDIGDVGLDNYVRHPSFEVLLCAWAVDDQSVHLWSPAEGEPMPEPLRILLFDSSVLLRAFNAPFEQETLRHGLRIDTVDTRWRCTMVEAYAASFTGGLEEVGAQIGLPQDKRKIAEGRRLIHRFCKPAPRNHKARRYTHETHPEEWARFREYCRQDVVAEREIARRLAVIQPMEPRA